jgi:hypothetical protein
VLPLRRRHPLIAEFVVGLDVIRSDSPTLAFVLPSGRHPLHARKLSAHVKLSLVLIIV